MKSLPKVTVSEVSTVFVEAGVVVVVDAEASFFFASALFLLAAAVSAAVAGLLSIVVPSDLTAAS